MGYKTTSIEVGTRFGRLSTIGPVELRPRKDGRNRAWVPVRCDCGSEDKSVTAFNLLSGVTSSCGCYQREMVSVGGSTKIQVERVRDGKTQVFSRARNHGQSRTPLYGVWKGMISRCEYPKADGYKWYGGKGISVCPEWRDDYLAFKDWALPNGYARGLELDREDSDGDYCPENCRWITKKANLRNRDLAWSDEIDEALVRQAKELNMSPYELIRIAVEEFLGVRGGSAARTLGGEAPDGH